MSRTPPSDTALRVADLSPSAKHAFSLRPGAEELAVIARDLGLSALRKLSFQGELTPLGKADWQLSARLGATVVQPCVVTLEPVTTRIDRDITHQFLTNLPEPDAAEVEMAEDDDASEALGVWIDPGLVMREALTLAVPDYPRKDDAALGQKVFAAPGQAPMTDEDAKPFAGLAGLKQQFEDDAE